MPAIISGISEGDKAAYGGQDHYRVSITRLGNGHAEASITRYTTLSELPPWYGQPDPFKEPPDPEENRRRAARRAKSMVRKKCKVLGVDSLWTLTYRENMQDEATLYRHWDAFCRRVREVIPGWVYVATVEKQERGALHIHIATHRLPTTIKHDGRLVRTGGRVKSWDVMRRIWRDVLARDGMAGNFDETKRKFFAKSRAHKIAKYIGKYVAKSFDGDASGKHRYWVSKGVELPRAQVLLFRRENLADLIALVHAELAAGGCAISTFYSADREVFWMSTEEDGPASNWSS